MGYWGTERLDSDSALDTMWVIEEMLVKQLKEAYDIGDIFAIADVVISNEQLGSNISSHNGSKGIVVDLIEILTKMYTYELSQGTPEFQTTILKTVSELSQKVIKHDIQVANAIARDNSYKYAPIN